MTIEERLLSQIRIEKDGFEETLRAVTNVFTILMALACPGCRKKIAKELRKRIPGMLAEANSIGAQTYNDPIHLKH